MIETFDSLTGFVADVDADNLSIDTTTKKQGTGSLKYDKTGVSTTAGAVLKTFGCPIDIAALKLAMPSATMSMWWNHADFTGVILVEFRLIYSYDTSGVPAAYDRWSLVGPTAGWSEITGTLSAPDATTVSSEEQRSHCIGLFINAAKSGTYSDMIADALTIKPGTGDALPGLLVFDSNRLMLPPFDTFNRNSDQNAKLNVAEAATERVLISRKQGIEFGLNQARNVWEAGAMVRGLEDHLRLFDQYAGENQGWSVSRDANAIADTTLSGAAAAGDLDIDLTAVTDLSYIGSAGMDLRIGPNDARQYDRVRVLSIDTLKVYIDRPLRFAHESGTKVRSANFYPSCAQTSSGSTVRETGNALTFNVKAVETD